MEVLTMAMQKGGTGKTTTAAVLAQLAALKGRKVLAIDLDAQGNFSFALGAKTNAGTTSYDLLKGTAGEPQITPQNIYVYPASQNLPTLQTEKGSARRLQDALISIKDSYDIVIIDTPPKADNLQYNALQAADGILIPLQADIFNLQGLYQISDTVQAFKQSNPKLTIKGMLLTRYDNRSTISKQMQEQIIVAANKLNIPYLGSVRNGIAIQEAAALQKNLYEYAPNSKPASDYLAIYNTLFN